MKFENRTVYVLALNAFPLGVYSDETAAFQAAFDHHAVNFGDAILYYKVSQHPIDRKSL